MDDGTGEFSGLLHTCAEGLDLAVTLVSQANIFEHFMGALHR